MTVAAAHGHNITRPRIIGMANDVHSTPYYLGVDVHAAETMESYIEMMISQIEISNKELQLCK